jgi:hypothetical protein
MVFTSYLGDILIHASFPLLLFATGFFHPLVLMGPLANYVFLRYVGGDGENEASQEKRYQVEDRVKYEQLQTWRREKNAFWPKLSELRNRWTWVVVCAGGVGVLVERSLRCAFAA